MVPKSKSQEHRTHYSSLTHTLKAHTHKLTTIKIPFFVDLLLFVFCFFFSFCNTLITFNYLLSRLRAVLRWNLIWASQGRNAGNRLLPVLVSPASAFVAFLCTIFATACVRVYTVCVVSVFVCLLAGWLTGARAHFEVPQHFLADTFYTRRAQHKICDSSFSAARLALIEFRLARLIVHFAKDYNKKKAESNKDTAFLLRFICLK